MLKMMSTALSTTFLMTGCMTEVDGQEENEASEEEVSVGTTEQAFTGGWHYSWGDTKTSAVDIGTSVGRTCFLSGLGGHMRPIGAYLYSGGTYPAMAGVRKKANGNYELYVQPDSGKHLIAFARCVNTDAGRVETGWTTGSQASQGDKILGAANGVRQCFLQDVKNFAVPIKDANGDIYSYGWAFDDAAHPDEIRVLNDGSYWKMWVKPGLHTYPVNIHATAVCIDTTQTLGEQTTIAADPGTASVNLTNVSGANCGLTGIRGTLDAALGDWNDSVHISTVSTQFKLNVANGKRGYAQCAK